MKVEKEQHFDDEGDRDGNDDGRVEPDLFQNDRAEDQRGKNPKRFLENIEEELSSESLCLDFVLRDTFEIEKNIAADSQEETKWQETQVVGLLKEKIKVNKKEHQ